MNFLEMLLQKKCEYEKELLFVEAKIAVVKDLIDGINAASAAEKAVEEIAEEDEAVEETVEQPTDQIY